jgi:hypothetical protein
MTIDLGVMALSMLRVEGWGDHVHYVRAGWGMAERIKPLDKPLDVWRRELNVEPIRHGQNSCYEVLAGLEL